MSNSMECPHCQQAITSNYCGSCGHPQKLKRIDGSYLKTELAKILYFEKGIFFTIKELLIRPGESVRTFLIWNRKHLVKPIVFLLICSLVYTLAENTFQFEQGVVEQNGFEKSTAGKLLAWVSSNYGYANMIMSIFITFWLKLFFRKSGYNLVEIFILLCFIMGMGMLFYSLIGALSIVFGGGTLLKVGGSIAVLYCGVAIGTFFEKNKVLSYIKGIVAYFLGSITFYVILIGIGKAIDAIIL